MRFPAPHFEMDWRADHRARAGESERAKREQKRCWNRIRCLYFKDALQHGGQETKSERAANRWAGERIVSLEVSDFGVINPRTNFLLVEGTYGSWRRLNAAFETGVQVDKGPGAHGYPLLWRAAADNSRNWMSKPSPEKRTHRSLSHERWSTDDTDILFRGANTRTLASHSWAVLFQWVQHYVQVVKKGRSIFIHLSSDAFFRYFFLRV